MRQYEVKLTVFTVLPFSSGPFLRDWLERHQPPVKQGGCLPPPSVPSVGAKQLPRFNVFKILET